jgi:glycosyltransferase involved in cell wall biosynthesis
VARIERAISDRTRDSVVRLMAIGRLLEQKQFHLVLWALAELGRSDIELDLVGEGPAELQLRDLTARLGLTERVRFHGGLYEPEEKWLVASRCHLGVLPGRGGLAVQELMWYGLPVVTGVADGTELDLVEEGVNGYVVDGGLDVRCIAERIQRFVETPLSGRTAMARAALETVRSQSNIGIMVERFMDAVTATLNAQRAATGAGSKLG